MSIKNTLRSLPLGARIPESPHAISCSLPRMADVIGYEEKRPETVKCIRSGYPRFVTHYLIEQVCSHWSAEFGWQGRMVLALTSARAAAELKAFCGEDGDAIKIREDDGLVAVGCCSHGDCWQLARKFVQHTGCGISSRQAEDFLRRHGLLQQGEVPEDTDDSAPLEKITEELRKLYELPSEELVIPANCGMNAFYATFRALASLQQAEGRDIWIQFGWLYVDTIEILKKFTHSTNHRVFHSDVFDLDKLAAFLNENGKRVAGIVTEMPTNPKVETPQADRLRDLASHHDIPLIVDPTLSSPWNIDVLPYADVVVNSLTKYAASEGDIMAGAVILNPSSPWAEKLQPEILRLREPLYQRDAARLAFEMRSYQQVVQKINANTLAVVAHLDSHPRVKKVLWAREEKSAANYDRITARECGPGGVITIELNMPLAPFYDALPMMKGPSFGTVFSLACPFMYLAHYNLVSTAEGRQHLLSQGLNPDLVRVSIGTEPAGDLIAAFDEALEA